MPIGMLFWMLMILWFICGLWANWPPPGAPRQSYGLVAGSLLLFILLFLVGWKVFGFVIQ